MDRKADKAQEHAEQLRRDREAIVDKIAGYHRHIDGCTAEISDCERRIDEYRAVVNTFHNDIYLLLQPSKPNQRNTLDPLLQLIAGAGWNIASNLFAGECSDKI